MDGLQKITTLHRPLCAGKSLAQSCAGQQPQVPAGPEATGPARRSEPSQAARSLDEVFGSTIAMLKDLSRASMNVAKATGHAARLKGSAQEGSAQPDGPPRQVDTLA